jgi:predicted lipoprotein with Yx(FWY)xxD motif
MHTSKLRYFAVAAVAAMALAACSSSSKPASSTTPSTSPDVSASTTAPSGTTAASGGGTTAATTVALADSKYGKILVDSKGMTLYVDEDDKPGAPACTGACLTAWPPLTASGTPTAGTGVTATKFATVTASDGTKQVTVNGSPLYLWQGDTKAGDVTGQDKNGFYVVMANGVKYDPS